MKRSVLISEYVCGGGFSSSELLLDILVEGYSMMYALAYDFVKAGFNVTLTLDYRLKGEIINDYMKDKVSIVKVKRDMNYLNTLVEYGSKTDYTVIIAPSSNGIIEKILAHLEEHNISYLNPNLTTVSRIINKYNLYKDLDRMGLKVPTSQLTSTSDVESLYRIARDVGLPVVLKPTYGDGAQATHLIRTRDDTLRYSKMYPNRDVVVQEFIEGVPASVSVAVGSGRFVILSLNKQEITVEPNTGRFSYGGGYTPLNVKLPKGYLEELLGKIVEVYPGLKGYVGIDIVLKDDEAFIMEINPRLTTSYLGVRNVIKENIAWCIVNLVEGVNVKVSTVSGRVCTFRVIGSSEDVTLTSKLIRKLNSINGVIVPPLPNYKLPSGTPIALIYSVESSLQRSLRLFEKLKDEVLEKISKTTRTSSRGE